ncbi:hypothetical protein ACN6QN_16495 [Acinetobacter baumannii]
MWSYKLGPSKPTGNVGQPANGNLQYLSCQCEICLLYTSDAADD